MIDHKLKVSREYGGWISTILIFGLTIGIVIIKRGNIIDSIIFWIPIFLGISIFDANIRNITNDKYVIAILFIATIIGVLSILIDFLFLITYLLFLIIFFSRPYFKKIRKTYINTALGMIALVLSFFITLHFAGINAAFFSIALLGYMIGAEFTVSSFLHKSKQLLAYNIVPVFFILLNPFYLIFSISLLRIALTIKSDKLKYVGIGESIFLLVIVVYVIILSLLGINLVQISSVFFR
ncbi:MAG: hypothetical protein ACP5NL_04735 [Thermoplasmata archaeon]